MLGGNRGIALTIILVVIICIAALVAVLYSLLMAIRDVEFGQMTALQPDRKVTFIERGTNFNFAIPEEKEAVQEKENDKQPEVAGLEAEKIEESKKIYNFNFVIPPKPANPSMTSIVIPEINYNSPVILSDDGDSAIDYGAWFYPESAHPYDGESIFLCHRRYFKANDPKSCWNLDKVSKGANLYINFSDGTQKSYKVSSMSVHPGTDLNIYRTSGDNRIKLISCAKEDGRIGSASHRIVLVAEEI